MRWPTRPRQVTSLLFWGMAGMAASCDSCCLTDLFHVVFLTFLFYPFLRTDGISLQGWQEKLSELKVANFPWDPQPEPPRQPPTVPSNVKPDIDVAAPVTQQEHVNFPNVQGVRIKTESGYDQPSMPAYAPPPVNGYSNNFNGDIAQQRAHALIAQRMVQGSGHIQMPQAQHAPAQMHNQQRMMPTQGQRPPQPQQAHQPQQSQPPQQQHAPQHQQQPHQRPQPAHVYASQTDGSDGSLEDWKAFMQAKSALDSNDPDARLAAENLMRTHLEAMAAQTDSGLGMPLSSVPKGKKAKAITRVRQAKQAEASSRTSAVPPVARFDGDDEENDEDAINSELDDPEDDLDNANDADDEMIDIMLCTYDKVQRVKNKWKCTLKDGILGTNKKEYLFHKATGEFEW
ncbi:TFIIA-domain-containing protein [Westerdykella ornata]|uniref:TFIIA-domain-containing protein n=1 Tax=Westerdykella ornata TaxID=318751 RepID=A0A6A6JB65_WESOR|nr:TFIIA-domain-containing protein [Westerdykella ornata]KAF2273444.1 TFIIA-domain-containing protein [Westerdykella ornata]